MSIFKKLLLLVSSTIFILVGALCFLGYFSISGMGDETAQQQLLVYSNVFQEKIDSFMQTQEILASSLQ